MNVNVRGRICQFREKAKKGREVEDREKRKLTRRRCLAFLV